MPIFSNTGKRGSAVAPVSPIKGAPRSQQTLGSLDNVAGDDCLVTTRGCSGRDKRRARGDRGGGDLRLLVGSGPDDGAGAVGSTAAPRGTPDFLAGYALGMQEAHLQALGAVKRTGAVEMGLLVCQQEQRRLQARTRAVELALACGAGRFTTQLEALEKRSAAAERARSADQRALDRALARIEQLEARTLWATAARVVGCLWGRGRVALQGLSPTCERSLGAALAGVWLVMRLASGFGGRRLSPRLGRCIEHLTYWSWLLFIASSHRAARRLLMRELGTRRTATRALAVPSTS